MMLLSLGFSMKAVQEQLGHAQFTTTANTYANVYMIRPDMKSPKRWDWYFQSGINVLCLF